MLLAIAKKCGQMAIAQWPTDRIALKYGQAGVKSRDGTILAGWRDSDGATASNGFVSKPVLIKMMEKETEGTFSDDRP